MRLSRRTAGLAAMNRGGARAIGRDWVVTMADNSRLFERIERLYDVGLLGKAKVLVAGCGSGGSQVALQLVMSGAAGFELYDKDTMGEENVIRHACGLRYVGWDKTKAVADILKDRNPAVRAECHQD